MDESIPIIPFYHIYAFNKQKNTFNWLTVPYKKGKAAESRSKNVQEVQATQNLNKNQTTENHHRAKL